MALKVLLADKGTTHQNMGKRILADAGYEVVTVSNGAAALKKIASEKPQILVLDVSMPGYSGVEICQKLRASMDNAGMPILLTANKTEPFKPEEAARVKADGLIIKPFEANTDLLPAVQKLAERVSAAALKAAPRERTQKIAPVVEETKDESYEAWKADSAEPEHAAPAVASVSVPAEMASASAFDEYSEPQAAAAAASESAPSGWSPAPAWSPAPPVYDEPAPVAPQFSVPATTPDTVAFEVQPIEPTSAADVAPAPAEPPSPPAPEPISFGGADPALVVDRTQMVNEFATQFGEGSGGEVTVGIVGPEVAEPPIEAASAEVSYAPAEQYAPRPQDFAQREDFAPEPAPAPAPELEPPPPPEVVTRTEGDTELAAALGAAISNAPVAAPEPMEPAAVPPDPQAEAVGRALERAFQRIKADLVAEVLRELRDPNTGY